MRRAVLTLVALASRSAFADPGVVAPVAETAASLGDVMATKGGWGLAALFAVVIWQLWRQNNSKDERIFQLLDKQNEILKALERLGGKAP